MKKAANSGGVTVVDSEKHLAPSGSRLLIKEVEASGLADVNGIELAQSALNLWDVIATGPDTTGFYQPGDRAMVGRKAIVVEHLMTPVSVRGSGTLYVVEEDLVHCKVLTPAN
jgi:hypothetical protein